MNISETNKIVLQALREVPQEVIFNSSKAIKDQIVPNRYHFRFPEQWANQLDKDAIIGFRNFYIVRHARFIVFEINIRCYSEIATWFELTTLMKVWLDNDDTIEKIPRIWEEFWYIDTKTINVENVEANDLFNNKELIDCWYMDGELHFGRLMKDNLELHGIEGHVEINLKTISEDARGIFNIDSITSIDELVVHNVWSRHQAYITSSISNETDDNFLGHTSSNRQYYPIKYYRLTSKNKQFWIDIFESRNHSVPIILSNDNKDVLYIEAIVCFSSNAMI